MSLSSAAQSPTPGEFISLYRLDATSVGGQVYYFTPGTVNDAKVMFGGVEYQPFDVMFEGFETNATGALPQPHMKVANATGTFQSIINLHGDLLGCPLQRVRTYKRFLDGEAEADPSAYWGPDAFRIERKVDESKLMIEWELSASLDQEGTMLPGRVVIRDTCLWRYRLSTGGDNFDYSHAECPYTGDQFFNSTDQPVEHGHQDVCSRHISGCKARFGASAALPFGGFPGVARVRG